MTDKPAQPQRTQSAEEFYKVWIAQHPKLLGKSVTWPISVCLFEFAEAYAQSLKQAAPPQAESPKDEVDYNECCCEDGYKMICPQHGTPQTLAVGHGVEMADDCAHRALDRLGVPRDGKGLYLRMQWLKDQIPKPIYPQYGTNSQTSEDYVRACEAQGIGPNILALTEPVADPSKEELKAECEMLREELCYHRDYWAEWNMRALTAQAQKEELKAAEENLADYAKRYFGLFDQYRNAWLREMGGVIRPKHWEIDGFVLRQRDIYEKAKLVDRIKQLMVKELKAKHSAEEMFDAVFKMLAEDRHDQIPTN